MARAALSAPQRRLLSALVATYPVSYDTLTPKLGAHWGRSIESLVRRGLVERVVRETTHANGYSRSYLGYIATPAGEALAAGTHSTRGNPQ